MFNNEFHKSVNASATEKSIQNTYRNDTVNERYYKRWFPSFQSGDFSLKDKSKKRVVEKKKKKKKKKKNDPKELEAVAPHPTLTARELTHQEMRNLKIASSSLFSWTCSFWSSLV